MEITSVALKNAENMNVIVGQSHFIKTVEDIHEAMVGAVPGAKFGVAFCEASGPRLIRTSGTDTKLVAEAARMAKLIGAGHVFVVTMQDMFPINVLKKLQQVDEIVTVFAATANPLEVVVAESKQGRGVLGVIDGGTPLGVESKKEAKERIRFLRQIGYKLT